MSKAWELKKRAHERTLAEFAAASPVFRVLSAQDGGAEWRAVVVYETHTLVKGYRGEIEKVGPVVVGIRYHERFLAEAPHPMEMVTILEPLHTFAPNIEPFSGALCLGHPEAGIGLDLILNQVYAGLVFNLKVVNTSFRQYVNPAAAEYVRANAPHLPLTRRGLFEPRDGETGGANKGDQP